MTEIKGKLYVHVLLDRSGSMLARKGPTVAAYNAYVDSLPDDAVVSLTTFSSRGILHPRVNVAKAKAKFSADEYECVGDTPLYDAIGSTIQMIDTAAKEYDRVTMVVQTDGQENRSREFNREQIKQLLTDKQEGEGWLVVFLGATLDAYQQAQHIGMVAANTMQYDAALSSQTMASVSRATQAYSLASTRAVGRSQAAFTDEERVTALKK